MLLTLRIPLLTPIIAYAAVFISTSLLYWVLCRQALHVEAPVQPLFVLLLFLLLLRASFLGMQPLGSDDFYRYVWDGRVQTAGINPYRYAPEDEALRSLHTEKVPSLVNHPGMKTIYFPFSHWLFWVGYQISGEEVWGFQLLILIAEVMTIMGLVLLMRELSLSAWRALLYAANPLVILQFSLDAHVDAFGFPFLILGLLFYYRKRTTLSLVLFGLSLLIKPVALVLLPILFLDQRGFLNRVRVAVIPLAILLIPFIPYAVNADPFEALTTFTKHWMFNGALFNVLFLLFNDNQTTRLWSFILLGAALAVLTLSERSMHEKIVLAVLLLLLFSPVVHPWYVGWLVVLLPLAPISSGVALAGTASLSILTVVTYQLHGVWREYPAVLVLEYVPVVVLLFFGLRGKGRGDSTHRRAEMQRGPAEMM